MPVDSLTLMAALLSGLLGGVHCAAMCGGIATGFSAMSPHGGLWQAVQVNLGRVSGYVLAGAIVGGFGGGLLRVFRMDLLVVGLRMAVGLVLVTVALRLLDHAEGDDIRLTLVKGADHRFSTHACLALISAAISGVLKGAV